MSIQLKKYSLQELLVVIRYPRPWHFLVSMTLTWSMRRSCMLCANHSWYMREVSVNYARCMRDLFVLCAILAWSIRDFQCFIRDSCVIHAWLIRELYAGHTWFSLLDLLILVLYVFYARYIRDSSVIHPWKCCHFSPRKCVFIVIKQILLETA